jgi:acetyl esterase
MTPQQLSATFFSGDVATHGGLQPLQQGVALNARCGELLLQSGALSAAVPAAELTPAKRRSLMLEAGKLFHTALDYPVRSTDLSVDLPGRTLPARLFEPAQLQSDVLLVFFHGGGWVIGDLQTHHQSCQFLAHHLGLRLLAVEYRKSPEHVFPAPCEDAVDALAWAYARKAQWGCARVAVSGDSAGGHLAAVAMHAHPELVAGALLFYPVTDVQFANRSYSERGAGPGLTKDSMVWFWQQFLASEQPASVPTAADARAVPMLQTWRAAPPPTVITAAWHDPLYDEAITYGQLLSRAGGRVVMQHAPDMAHGFLRQAFVSPSARSHVLAAAHAFAAILA